MNSVINGIKNIQLRKVFFAFFCMVAVHPVLAQDPAPAQEIEVKLKFADKLTHWMYAYGLSNPEFMTQRRNDFKTSSYAEVYIEGIIDHDAWMFTLLNKVTKFRHQEKQTPHLVFEVKFKPTTDALDNYTITLTLQKSGEISQDLESVANAAAEKYFKGKNYAEPAIAVEDIEKALTEALDGVEKKLGNVLAPNLMVRYLNEVFWNGHEIPILDSEGNSVELEAIDKDGKVLDPGQITWTNADPFQSKGVVDMTGVNSKSVTLTKQGETRPLNVTVVRAGSSDDINELLKMLIVEALTSKKQEAMDSLAILRRDSVENASALIAQLARLESGNLPMEDIGVKPVALFSTPPVVSALDEKAFEEGNVGNDRKNGFEHLRKRKRLKNTIRKKVNVVALANLIVDQPEKINILLDALLLNSGRLVARLILNKDSQGKRDAARNIVVDFLNQNLEKIAGSQFQQVQEPEPALPVPAPAAPPSFTFSPEEPLYVSPMVAFEGKQAFIDDMKTYLRQLEPRVYVAINYSQDVSTENYLGRANYAKPQVIPAGQKYLAITLVNIPGSTKSQLTINADQGIVNLSDISESLSEKEKLIRVVKNNVLPYEAWTSLEGDLISNIAGNEHKIKSFLSPAGKIITLPENARDFTFLNGYLVKFTIGDERYIGLVKNTSPKTFSGYFFDAVRNLDGTFKTSNSQPYAGVTDNTADKAIIFYALKSLEGCGVFKISKATYKEKIEVTNGGVGAPAGVYLNYQINALTDILENYEDLPDIREDINCLSGRAKELYKFILEHYGSNGIVLLDAYKNSLLSELKSFTEVRIKTLDGDFIGAGQVESVRIREMLKYGHEEFLQELKDITSEMAPSETKILVVEFEDYNIIKEIYFVYDIAVKLDTDCALAEHIRDEINNQYREKGAAIEFNLDFFTAVGKAALKDIYESGNGNEIIELISCLLNKLKATPSVYNPNRIDYKFKGLYEAVFQRFMHMDPESYAAKIPSGLVSYNFACSCGAWNSLVDLVLGLAVLGDGATTNPFELYDNVADFGSQVTSLEGLSNMGDGMWTMLKDHHGYVNGASTDYYQLTYGVCYDAIFAASFFIGIGEINALSKAADLSEMGRIIVRAAKAYPKNTIVSFAELTRVAATFSNVALRKIVLEIVEKVPGVVAKLPPGGKSIIFAIGLNDVVHFTNLGVEILKPASSAGRSLRIIYESSELVTDIKNGKTAKLKFIDEGEGVVTAYAEDAARIITKADLLGGLKDFPNVEKWATSFDDVVDASLIKKLYELDLTLLRNLDKDISGTAIKKLFKENPEGLDAWKDLTTIGRREDAIPLGHDLRTNTIFLDRYSKLDPSKRAKLRDYLDQQKSFAGRKGQVNYVETKHIDGVGDVTIRYDEYGFPNFTDFCPRPTNKYVFYADDLKGTAADFRRANERLAREYGFEKPYLKGPDNKYLELESGDFRWTPGTQNFYRKVNGVWVKHTWHHHQDGRSLFPLDSRIHNTSEPGSSGFPHSGGDALILDDLKGVFESPIFK